MIRIGDENFSDSLDYPEFFKMKANEKGQAIEGGRYLCHIEHLRKQCPENNENEDCTVYKKKGST